MTLVAMEIPDDPAHWPQWLERELVGLRLGDLVGELQVIAGKEAGPAPSLKQIIGDHVNAICENSAYRRRMRPICFAVEPS